MTKEQRKSVILSHLQFLISQSSGFEDYSATAISKVLPEDKDRVIEALNELEREKAVNTRQIELKIYVPSSKEGKGVLSDIA